MQCSTSLDVLAAYKVYHMMPYTQSSHLITFGKDLQHVDLLTVQRVFES